jgi:hypothetical protein
MAYAEASLIVEGALDETATFHDVTLLDHWASSVLNECKADGLSAEVFVIWHEHSEGIECECVQYLTDHHAYMTTD